MTGMLYLFQRGSVKITKKQLRKLIIETTITPANYPEPQDIAKLPELKAHPGIRRLLLSDDPSNINMGYHVMQSIPELKWIMSKYFADPYPAGPGDDPHGYGYVHDPEVEAMQKLDFENIGQFNYAMKAIEHLADDVEKGYGWITPDYAVHSLNLGYPHVELTPEIEETLFKTLDARGLLRHEDEEENSEDYDW